MGLHGQGDECGWNGIKHAAAGLWSSKNVFCEVLNHTFLFGSLMGKSRFDGCRKNVPCLTTLCQL